MTVSTVKVRCRLWGHQFKVPFLPDFSYGQFIYSSHDGRNYRYLDGLNNKTWDFVQKVIRDANNKMKNEGEVIQAILGRIADRASSTDFYQNKKIICPSCGRKVWHIYRDEVVGSVEVKEMTFDRFEHLTPGEKVKEIESLIERPPNTASF